MRFSDIYSMGGVFYFLLTGVKPTDAIARHINPMPEPKMLTQDVPEVVNSIILKAMHMEPEKRYGRAQEFINHLQQESSVKAAKPVATPKTVTIGRSTGNHVIVNDPLTSRFHLQITCDNNGCFRLTDLNSTNGTFVNDKRIKGEVIIKNNDTVRIGNTRLPWTKFFNEQVRQIRTGTQTPTPISFGIIIHSMIVSFMLPVR